MPRRTTRGSVHALIGLVFALFACIDHATAEDLSLAPAEPATLLTSEYALAPAGTIVTWQNLISGKKTDEEVDTAQGLMMRSHVGDRRSFAYLPDPWADNENTRQDDIGPLFPFEVGKEGQLQPQS